MRPDVVLAAAAVDAQPQQSVIVESPTFDNGMRAAAEGDLFRASAIFNILLRRQPHSPDAYLGLAEVQRLGGHLDEADTWLQRGVAANTDTDELLRARSQIAIQQHRLGDAATLLAAVTGRNPDDKQGRALLAELYAALPGDQIHAPARAAAAPASKSIAVRKAIPTERLSASQYYRLGTIAAGHGNISAAQQFLEKALRLAPWMAQAQEALWALPDAASGHAPNRAAEKSPREIPHAKDS